MFGDAGSMWKYRASETGAVGVTPSGHQPSERDGLDGHSQLWDLWALVNAPCCQETTRHFTALFDFLELTIPN